MQKCLSYTIKSILWKIFDVRTCIDILFTNFPVRSLTQKLTNSPRTFKIYQPPRTFKNLSNTMLVYNGKKSKNDIEEALLLSFKLVIVWRAGSLFTSANPKRTRFRKKTTLFTTFFYSFAH